MIVLKSPAKVNLFLKVVGKNEDGYHNLFMVMGFIDLMDIITIKENRNHFPSIIMKGKYGSKFDNIDEDSMEQNLIFKALNLMNKKYSISTNFDIEVEKNIPIAAGLGGGSSNAGVIIKFCNDYFGLDIPEAQLMNDAKEIGADVPFFMQSNTSICEGIGDIMTTVKLTDLSSKLPMLLASPAFGMSTPEVFKKYASSPSYFPQKEAEVIKGKINKEIPLDEMVKNIAQIGNDLLDPALSIRPEIGDLIKEMAKQKGAILSDMSGSGSSCFTIFESDEDLNNAMANLKGTFKTTEFINTDLLASFQGNKIISASKPSMEMIFHRNNPDDGKWITIKQD